MYRIPNLAAAQIADLILLDIQNNPLSKGLRSRMEVDITATRCQYCWPLSEIGSAAAADDDAPRRIPSPLPDASVAAKFEDAAFDFTKLDIYNEGSRGHSVRSFRIL